MLTGTTASTPVSCWGSSDGTATVIAAGGTAPYTHNWSTNPVQTGPTATGLPAGPVSVLINDANGCSVSSSAVITEPTALEVVIAGSDQICLGSTANLSATVTGGNPGYSFDWTSTPVGTASNQPNLNISPQTQTTYTVSVTDLNGCQMNTSHLVEVLPLPEADFVAGPLEGCDSLEVFFQNNSTGGSSFLWRFGDGSTSTEENPAHVFGPGTFDVTLVVTSREGCMDSTVQPALVTVLPSPIASFTTLEDLSNGMPQGNAEIHFQNTSQFATSYFWELGDGAVSADVNPVHQYQSPGIFTITLFAFNDLGCVDSTQLSGFEVLSDGQIFSPNAFTPNGDGTNETFQLKGEGVTDFLLIIYDRWGREIFRSYSLNHSWDGTFQGEAVQEGVYIWKMEAGFNSGSRVERGGTVTLIR